MFAHRLYTWQAASCSSSGWRYVTILFSYHTSCRDSARPITAWTIMSSPGLTLAPGLRTAIPCTLSTGLVLRVLSPDIEGCTGLLHVITDYIDWYYVLLQSSSLSQCIITSSYYETFSHYYYLLWNISYYVLFSIIEKSLLLAITYYFVINVIITHCYV